MVEYTIRAAGLADAVELAERMQPVFRDEIQAMSARTPIAEAVQSWLKSRVCRAARADGALMCVYGSSPVGGLSSTGIVWMLATDTLSAHALRFLRQSREELADLTAGYDRVLNWCDARNTVSVRWLAWLGFDIEPAIRIGVEQRPFHRFTLEVV